MYTAPTTTQQKPKKSPWLPLIGAILLIPPGAITWSFALHEATDFTSDWVLIGGPLLVLGGLSFTLFLARLLRVAGLVLGALLVLGGLTWEVLALQASIADREEHRRSYEALRDTSRLCDGLAAANPQAAQYTGSGLSKTEVYTRRGTAGWDTSYDSAFTRWRPEGIRDAALVACVQEVERVLESCDYSGGRTLRRAQVDTDVSLYAIATGQLVTRTILPGGMPRACQMSEEFYGSSGGSTLRGEVAPLASVADALRPFVERP